MTLDDALPLAPRAIENTSRAAKEELFVDFQQLFGPKVVFVENVGAEEFGSYPASQILDTFSSETSLNCGIVLMNI